MKLEFSQFK